MQYRIFKRDNTIEVKGFERSIPDSLKNAAFLLPFSQKADSVAFLMQEEQTLNAALQYCTETQFLLSIYSICKHMETVSDRSEMLLQFVPDGQYIFLDRDATVHGILAPRDSAEQADYKGFFWNLFFVASFQSKNIPVVREMLGFIRAARAVTPRDLILFIEMSTLGKDILSSFQSRMQGTEEPEQIDRQEETPDPSALQTGNDFSDFLKSFEQPMDMYEDWLDTPEEEPVKEASAPVLSETPSEYSFASSFLDASVGEPLAAEEAARETPLDEPLAVEEAVQETPLDEPLAAVQAREVVPEPEPAHVNPAPQYVEPSDNVRRVQERSVQAPAARVRHIEVPAGRQGGSSVLPAEETRYFLVASDGRSIPLLKARIQIGRNPQGVDLPVQDMYVSRVHAQITRDVSGVYYTDLNPRNPSFINGVSILPNTPHPLKDADKIQLGRTVFYFRCVKTAR